jgi:hypothetical protein
VLVVGSGVGGESCTDDIPLSFDNGDLFDILVHVRTPLDFCLLLLLLCIISSQQSSSFSFFARILDSSCLFVSFRVFENFCFVSHASQHQQKQQRNKRSLNLI